MFTAFSNAEFVDGKLTAGWYAQQVKNNAQLKNDAAPTQELRNLVNQALKRNSLFQIAARPKAMRPIMLSRYQGGMYYGTHIDNAIMGDEELMRSDLSLTLFLSYPASYTGGELVIESTQGQQAFKLDAGSMVEQDLRKRPRNKGNHRGDCPYIHTRYRCRASRTM